MKPVILLNKLDLLRGKTMLDVGARDCSNCVDFIEKGFSIDAIDIKAEPVSCKKMA